MYISNTRILFPCQSLQQQNWNKQTGDHRPGRSLSSWWLCSVWLFSIKNFLLLLPREVSPSCVRFCILMISMTRISTHMHIYTHCHSLLQQLHSSGFTILLVPHKQSQYIYMYTGCPNTGPLYQKQWITSEATSCSFCKQDEWVYQCFKHRDKIPSLRSFTARSQQHNVTDASHIVLFNDRPHASEKAQNYRVHWCFTK